MIVIQVKIFYDSSHVSQTKILGKKCDFIIQIKHLFYLNHDLVLGFFLLKSCLQDFLDSSCKLSDLKHFALIFAQRHVLCMQNTFK